MYVVVVFDYVFDSCCIEILVVSFEGVFEGMLIVVVFGSWCVVCEVYVLWLVVVVGFFEFLV